MQMVLNELSAKFPVNSIHEGHRVMEEFLNTYFKVKAITKNDRILLDQNYNDLQLAKGYWIHTWRNDKDVDIEVKRRFKFLINRSDIYNTREFEQTNLVNLSKEFQHGDRESKGCLIAYEMGGVAISFLSDEYWKCDMIEGTYMEMDGDGELSSIQIYIPNVSYNNNIDHFKSYYQQIVKDQVNIIKDGKDILKENELIFSNLIFCGNAVEQLQHKIGPSEVNQVYKKLLELQSAIEKMENVFKPELLNKASPESKETLKKFKEEHTFKLPDGTIQLFSWHVRFTGSFSGRIFFHIEFKNRKIYIGHIGKKLPTVLYH